MLKGLAWYRSTHLLSLVTHQFTMAFFISFGVKNTPTSTLCTDCLTFTLQTWEMLLKITIKGRFYMLLKGSIVSTVDCACLRNWTHSIMLKNFCLNSWLWTVIASRKRKLNKFKLISFSCQMPNENLVLGLVICKFRITFYFFFALLFAKAFRSSWWLFSSPCDLMQLTRTGKESIFLPSQYLLHLWHASSRTSAFLCEFHSHLTL